MGRKSTTQPDRWRAGGSLRRARGGLPHLLPAAAVALLTVAVLALGQTPATLASQSKQPHAAPAREIRRIAIVLARELRDLPPPISPLDIRSPDEGVAGARLAINDNNTTGRFLGQEFTLTVVESSNPAELATDVKKQLDAGASFIVADASAQTLLALSDAVKGRDALILNAGASDDRLREQDCRPNVVHTAPSRSMLADGLAQYLRWKRWQRWFLVYGTEPDDKAFADALRRSATRFGLKIVEERQFGEDVGGRAEGGHEQIQEQIPAFTQRAAAHDVLMVADESGRFGEYFPYRTFDPRPVAGTQGLVPTSWHPALEQWGATQIQNRFRRLANRPLESLDYDAWVAVRAIGEAATRGKTTAPADLIAYSKSPAFELAAFKGRKLSFRDWDGQLRQPILIGTAKLPVSVSPQPGFLHQFTELDTLGFDKPETNCRAYAP
jgi:ABC transporter substrate binding protein (PQQ-dependent alcohol dehydrogenase system)